MTFLEKFRLEFPELSNATNERVEYFKERAERLISAKRWRNLYDDGLLTLTAHLLTMRFGLDGNGAPITAVPQEVTSKTIGKMSKGMSSKNSDIYAGAGDYASTVYGRAYWELAQRVQTVGMIFNV